MASSSSSGGGGGRTTTPASVTESTVQQQQQQQQQDPLHHVRTITHTASGASLRIHPFGATVVGFTNGQGREVLFVSKLAKLDGSAPIRGGIPICFPIFGPPPAPPTTTMTTTTAAAAAAGAAGSSSSSSSLMSTMPQHGYARRNYWTWIDSYDEPDRAGVTLELMLSLDLDGIGTANEWAKSTPPPLYQCTLVLTAECTADTLTTTLQVRNTSPTIPFAFQALQHTYLAIPAAAVTAAAATPATTTATNPCCYVTGLVGYTVTDKVTRAIPHVNVDEAIAIGGGEIDRVYDPPVSNDHPDNGQTKHKNVMVTVRVPGSGGSASGESALAVDEPRDNNNNGNSNSSTTVPWVELTATGAINGSTLPVSCVVWNPHVDKARAMADFADDEYQNMVCVEPGLLWGGGAAAAAKTALWLEAGQTACLTQTIKTSS